MAPAGPSSALLPAITGRCAALFERPTPAPRAHRWSSPSVSLVLPLGPVSPASQLGATTWRTGSHSSAPACEGDRCDTAREVLATASSCPAARRLGRATSPRRAASESTGTLQNFDVDVGFDTNCSPRVVLSEVDSVPAQAEAQMATDSDAGLSEAPAGYPPRAKARKRRCSSTSKQKGRSGLRKGSSGQSKAALEPPRPLPGAQGAPKVLYVCQFGNNSLLLRQLLRSRPGWAPGPGDPGNTLNKASYEEKCVRYTPSDDLPEAQFLWSQWGHAAVFDALAAEDMGFLVVHNDEEKLELRVRPRIAANPQMPTLPRYYNHFEGGGALCTKNELRDTMVQYFVQRGYDPFGVVPMTYVMHSSQDKQHALWRQVYDKVEAESGQRVWLVKPGEWANRGCGIRIYDNASDVSERIDTKAKPWIVQKYIEKPLLVHRRKFDIRAYCLVTQEPNGGAFHAYAYHLAYLRTTSAIYTTKTLDRLVHLNNDAVQKKGENYGKYESANKLSMDEFQRYLNEHHAQDRVSVHEHIVPQMRGLMADSIAAAADVLNPRGIANCFEVFGFDFMVDESFRVWLIEINANPCIELCCNHLSQLIPKMLDEALQMTVDRAFPQATADAKQASERTRAGGALGGWEPLFGREGVSPGSAACGGPVYSTWAPQLPAGSKSGDEVDFTQLGRDIIEPSKSFLQSAKLPAYVTSPQLRRRSVRGESERPSKPPLQSFRIS